MTAKPLPQTQSGGVFSVDMISLTMCFMIPDSEKIRTFAALIFIDIIMKRRYLNPKNVIPFKRVFGENPELLQSFLNAGMPFLPDQYIKSLEYLPPELLANEYIRKAIDLCEYETFSTAELDAYDRHWDCCTQRTR
jgi:hypothetical protein